MRNLMRDLWKSVLGLCVIGIGLGVSAPAQAASANGPYYATPSWDQKLDAATRFVVLLNWNSDAVLDRETGLVWEKAPSRSGFNWLNASNHCVQLNLGGRRGWRLPTIQDLASLIDPTVGFPPSLPAGHPFTVQPFEYWSASTRASSDPVAAWVVEFGLGSISTFEKSSEIFAWCVRGGQGVDPQ